MSIRPERRDGDASAGAGRDGLRHGWGWASKPGRRRIVQGDFRPDFRLQLFLEQHRLLLHFDQRLLQAFPVTGYRFRNADDRGLHRNEQGPTHQRDAGDQPA